MKKPVSLKVLDTINVETPCHESWDAMRGDEQRRFCEQCRHSVNNISEMTREQAAEVIASAAPGTRVCVRYRRGADGAIQFRQSPSKMTFPALLKRAAMIGFGVMAFLHSNARAETTIQGDIAEVPKEERIKMGEMVAVPQAQQTPGPTAAPEATLPCHTMGAVALPEKAPTPHPEVHILGKIKAPETKK